MRLRTETGEEYHAHFYHHNISHRPRRPHLRTEVRLHAGPCRFEGEKGTGPCVVEAAHAVATTHSRLDVFNKKVGRAVALDRVLKGLTGLEDDPIFPQPLLPREIRTQLWDNYKAQAKLPESNGVRSRQ